MLREPKFGRAGDFSSPVFIAVLLVMILGAPELRGQSEKTSPAGSVPFAVGEVLDYRLSWSVFSNAAAVQLAVVEKRDLFGIPAWHFRASDLRGSLPIHRAQHIQRRERIPRVRFH